MPFCMVNCIAVPAVIKSIVFVDYGANYNHPSFTASVIMRKKDDSDVLFFGATSQMLKA